MKQDLGKKLVEKCLSNYNGNLAAILIFGSYNIGPFVDGNSDLDTIILLKKNENIDFKKESKDLLESLRDLNIALHHFRTIDNYKAHIYQKGSWSSWITVICGSKIAYSTPEFERFRKELRNNPIKKERLIEYIEHKDVADFGVDFNKSEAYARTKALFSHIRRKLQILNYCNGNKLDFDYMRCLKRLRGLENEQKLEELSKFYEKREGISLDETKKYITIAKELTKNVLRKLER